MIDVPTLAWFAGILDLKGRTRVVEHASRRTPLFVLQVESTNAVIVRRLCKLTGTRPQTSGAKTLTFANRRSCVQHCPEPHQHISSHLPDVARWHISGAGAAVVLHNVVPYCGTDTGPREEFIAQILSHVRMHGQGRHAVDQTLARMTDLGWEIPIGLERAWPCPK